VLFHEFRRDDWIGAGRFVGHWHGTLLSSPEALNHATGNNSNIAVQDWSKQQTLMERPFKA
jgi:transcription elongation factor